MNWLQQKNYWNLAQLQQHISDTYRIKFKSRQSYYELYAVAGISWKKTQKCNQKKAPQLVQKKLEILAQRSQWQPEIVAGRMSVFFLDEYHLLWGDVCSYIWGKSNTPIEVPIVNERDQQTYYGALDYFNHEF